jgi:hypothetical protein
MRNRSGNCRANFPIVDPVRVTEFDFGKANQLTLFSFEPTGCDLQTTIVPAKSIILSSDRAGQEEENVWDATLFIS